MPYFPSCLQVLSVIFLGAVRSPFFLFLDSLSLEKTKNDLEKGMEKVLHFASQILYEP